jgi:hypothetical protein
MAATTAAVIGAVGTVAGLGMSAYSMSQSGKVHTLNPYRVMKANFRGLSEFSQPVFNLTAKMLPQYTELERQNFVQRLEAIKGLQPQVDQMEMERLSRMRGGEIADVEKYGARAVEAFRQADPLRYGLEQQLVGGIQQNMMGEMDPFQRRMLQQDIRQAQAARGVGYSGGDAALEAFYQAQSRAAMQQQGQQAAMQYLSLPQPDPFLTVLNRTSIAGGLGPGAIGQGGPMFDPSNPAMMGIHQQNMAARNQAMQNQAAAQAGMGSGMMNFGGSMLGAAIPLLDKAKAAPTQG